MTRKLTDVTPFIMLVISAFTGVCKYFNFYSELFLLLPDLIGYSILANITMLRLYKPKYYCNATRLAIYGLLAMNIVSILTIDTIYFKNPLSLFYNPLYDCYILISVIAVIYYLKIKE